MEPFHTGYRDHNERTTSPGQLTHLQVRLLFPSPHTRNPRNFRMSRYSKLNGAPTDLSQVNGKRTAVVKWFSWTGGDR